jgi:hypothetical protein
LCLFAPCTKFQITTKVDGANSTKPLLAAVFFSLIFRNLENNLKISLKMFANYLLDFKILSFAHNG